MFSGDPATGGCTGNRGEGAAGGPSGLGPAPPSVGWQSDNRGPFYMMHIFMFTEKDGEQQNCQLTNTWRWPRGATAVAGRGLPERPTQRKLLQFSPAGVLELLLLALLLVLWLLFARLAWPGLKERLTGATNSVGRLPPAGLRPLNSWWLLAFSSSSLSLSH